jgi:hypothetical protein
MASSKGMVSPFFLSDRPSQIPQHILEIFEWATSYPEQTKRPSCGGHISKQHSKMHVIHGKR